MAEAAIMAASLAVSAYSTYQQNQQSNAQNTAAGNLLNQQKAQETTATQQAAQQTSGQQSQDAQWTQMRTLASTMQGLSQQPPTSLTSLTGSSLGAQAQARAGRV